MNQRIGVIDIGSLKVKSLIVDVGLDNSLTTIHQDNVLTKLGVGLPQNNGVIKPQHIAHTITELQRCQRLLESNNVDRVRVVSTHALREMPNGQEIAREIEHQTGLTVEIISQQEEAELFFQAVMHDFKTDQDFAMADIGGGSVQILIGNRDALKHIFLLKMGTHYLHDNFTAHRGEDGFPRPEEIAKMRTYVLGQLAVLPAEIKTPLIYGSLNIIKLFQALGLPLEPQSISPNHPYKARVEDMKKFLSEITPVPYGDRERRFNFSERYYMYGIDKAFLNVTSIADTLGAPYVIPSNANISQGLVHSML